MLYLACIKPTAPCLSVLYLAGITPTHRSCRLYCVCVCGRLGDHHRATLYTLVLSLKVTNRKTTAAVQAARLPTTG